MQVGGDSKKPQLMTAFRDDKTQSKDDAIHLFIRE